MQVGDVDLAVVEAGDPAGPPFVWGHGLTSSMAAEDDTGVFDWSAAPARVVRYDARGHGRSGPAASEDGYRWENLAGDMLALLDALALPHAVVGGASMGCATALHAAVLAPERIDGLVLVIPPTAWSTRPGQARLYRIGARTVQTVGLGPFVAAAKLTPAPAIFRGPLRGMKDATTTRLAQLDRHTLPAILRGAAASDLPAPDVLTTVDAPALILAWDTDAGHPVSTAEQLTDCLPKAELHVAREPEDVLGWPDRVSEFLTGMA